MSLFARGPTNGLPPMKFKWSEEPSCLLLQKTTGCHPLHCEKQIFTPKRWPKESGSGRDPNLLLRRNVSGPEKSKSGCLQFCTSAIARCAPRWSLSSCPEFFHKANSAPLANHRPTDPNPIRKPCKCRERPCPIFRQEKQRFPRAIDPLERKLPFAHP